MHKQHRRCVLIFALACAAVVSGTSCERSQSATDSHYALETIVNFGAGGDSERFRRQGWSVTEKPFTWALGPRAVLEFKLPPGHRPLGVRMRLAGMHNPPELPFQPVEVRVNGTTVAHWQVSRRADFTAVVPLHVVQQKPHLMIELVLPQATSPKALGLNADSRVLGVSCFELQILRAAVMADTSSVQSRTNSL